MFSSGLASAAKTLALSGAGLDIRVMLNVFAFPFYSHQIRIKLKK